MLTPFWTLVFWASQRIHSFNSKHSLGVSVLFPCFSHKETEFLDGLLTCTESHGEREKDPRSKPRSFCQPSLPLSVHSITDVCMNPLVRNEEELGAKSSCVLQPFQHVLWPEQKFQRHLARSNKVWHAERRKRKCHVGWRWGTDLGTMFGEWHLHGSCGVCEEEKREKGILGSVALDHELNPHGIILRVTSKD